MTKKPQSSSAEQLRAYFASVPPEPKRVLRKLRAAIRSAAPAGAIEGISYGIPVVRIDGRPLVWYAGWKKHVSMYPMTAAILRTCAVEGYETSKGTIRFPLSKRLPVALIRCLVKSRLAELRRKKP